MNNLNNPTMSGKVYSDTKIRIADLTPVSKLKYDCGYISWLLRMYFLPCIKRNEVFELSAAAVIKRLQYISCIDNPINGYLNWISKDVFADIKSQEEAYQKFCNVGFNKLQLIIRQFIIDPNINPRYLSTLLGLAGVRRSGSMSTIKRCIEILDKLYEDISTNPDPEAKLTPTPNDGYLWLSLKRDNAQELITYLEYFFYRVYERTTILEPLNLIPRCSTEESLFYRPLDDIDINKFIGCSGYVGTKDYKVNFTIVVDYISVSYSGGIVNFKMTPAPLQRRFNIRLIK